jgi:hypothetical protein
VSQLRSPCSRKLKCFEDWYDAECQNYPEINLFLFFIFFGLWGYWHCGHSWPILRQLRVIMKMIVEKQMECRLTGETEVLGENLPQCHFCVHHKIPRDQTRVWTRAAAVGSRRLTAWAMARQTWRLITFVKEATIGYPRTDEPSPPSRLVSLPLLSALFSEMLFRLTFRDFWSSKFQIPCPFLIV